MSFFLPFFFLPDSVIQPLFYSANGRIKEEDMGKLDEKEKQ